MSKKDKGLQPQKAVDVDESKIKFPCYLFKKYDGCRMLNLFGTAIGRSMKTHGNRYITTEFSKPCYVGMDGEVIAAAENAQDLCRTTTSAINSHDGQPAVEWLVFDYVTEETKDLPYSQRYELLKQKVAECGDKRVRVAEVYLVNNLEEMHALEEKWLAENYEGLIGRSLEGRHKSGRATMREGSYWRKKQFSDAEAICTGLEEACENRNDAKTNELGLTERSTHKENMVPKGVVGNLLARACEDIVVNGKVLVAKGQQMVIGPGCMTHDMRKYYWENKDKIIGQYVKFKFFAHGVKEKVRFPVYLGLRAESDIG